MRPQDWKNRIQEYIKEHKQRKRWRRLTAILAAATVVLVAAVIILPAFTMENSPQMLECEPNLHTHTDGCYDGESIVCGYADFVVHTHSAACYDADGRLICPLDEIEAHTHDDSCYGDPVLICGLEEGETASDAQIMEAEPGHVHTEGCYDEQLACGQEESAGHTHTEACYGTEQSLVCTLTEHIHTEECYADGMPACGMEEHVHGQECYTQVQVLTCGQEESPGHEHSENCYESVLICSQGDPAQDTEDTDASVSAGAADSDGQGHVHTDACYGEPELLCGKEEIILHTHDDSCFDESGNLNCGLLEVKEHIHDESCIPPAESGGGEGETDLDLQSGTSRATVEKPGYDPEGRQPAANRLISALNDTVGTDFGQYITDTTIETRSDGEWELVEGSVTAGAEIRVTINYSIPANIVTQDNRVIYYQLPDGIGLAEHETGYVTIGDANAGSYTITTDGLITITFNDTFSDGRAFDGDIQFQGTVSFTGDGEEDEIVFGGEGGTITVVPDSGDTDLRITKTGTYNPDEGKIYYTVIVSSEQGSDGLIDVTDKFLNLTGGVSYDEHSINIAGPAGEDVDAEINVHNGNTWFDIYDLPALEAGESYTITYTASVDLENTGTEDGSLTVRNQALASDETNNVQTINEIEISGARIEKTGVYNPTTREVQWTVYIYNPQGYDLAGKELSDQMVWTYGGQEQTVTITSATLTPYTGETPGAAEEITLPYIFPENSTQSYILTYTTPLPEDAAAGEALSVTNTALLGSWKAVYTIDGTMPGETGLVKYAESRTGDAYTGDVKWVSTITFPQNSLTGETLESIRYVDIINDAVDEGWQLRTGTHYTTPELLEDLVAAAWVGTTERLSLSYGTDYTIQVVTAEDFQNALGTDYYNAAGVEYVYQNVTFDQLFNGFVFDGETFEFNWQELDQVADGTPIAMFAVTFTEAALEKVNEAGQISLSYYTHYNLDNVTGNGTFTLVNGGRTPSNSAASSIQTALLDQLSKQVSNTGTHDYDLDSDAYGQDPVEIDVGDTDGRIYYRILFYNFDDEIEVHDDMWQQFNGHITFDSIKIYDPVTGELLETVKVWGGGHFGSNPDAGTYTLTNLDDYKGCIIGLYYSIDVSDDLAEGETKTYINTVEWTNVGEDSATANVTNSGSTLEKTGEALDNGLVRYYVTINPGGRDLLENGNTLTLTDTLTLSANSAAATFRPETAKLYRYDQEAEKHIGEDITESLSLSYDETTHTITFTLPDQTACVVVYEYEITRGTAAGNIEVSNTAQLTGVASTGSGSEIVLEDQSSGATVNSATLRIYKHEAGSTNKLLSNAHFTLERYEEQEGGVYEWTPSTLTAIGEDGSFIVSEAGYIELNFLNHSGTGSLYNTLYRLEETQAPEGYTANGGYDYFVWMEQGKNEDETFNAMVEAGAWPDGVDRGEVYFIAYSTNGAIYVPNEPETTYITVIKQWRDGDGNPLADGLPESITVTLYQQAGENGEKIQYGEPVIITPDGDGNWTHTWTDLPKEDENGNEYVYTVEETHMDGWETSYTYPVEDGGNAGIPSGEITVINTKTSGYVLPETGGMGPTIFITAGLLVIGASGAGYLYMRRGRRRGGNGP